MISQRKIEETLIRIGVPVGIQGFRYITDAIKLLDKPEWKNIKMIALYEKVANMNNATAGSVERAIRHALTVTRNHVGETEDVLHYIGGKGSKSSDSLKMLHTRLKNESCVELPKSDTGEPNQDEITLRRIIREEVRELLKGILLGGDTL